MEGDHPGLGRHYVYALIWMRAGDEILLWAAWPGEPSETLNVLDRTSWGLRIYP